MSAWHAEELLRPITADLPCGENLEDTALLASFDAFRVFGRQTPYETPPEWDAIRDAAIEALARSKDLRLLAHLGAAVLRTDGLRAFGETVMAAAGWLETYWDGTYPLVDGDAMLRRNALNCFADTHAVVNGLRRAPLVSSRAHGVVTLRDLDVAAGTTPAGDRDQVLDEAQVNAAFAELASEALHQLHQSVTGAIAAVKRIDAAMSAAGGVEATPELGPLATLLARIERTLRAQAALRPDAAEPSGDAAAPAARPGAGGTAVQTVGAIASRQDAIRALDAVAAFFRQHEPSSPVPLFVERAKRLVSKDFLEVLADIAPDAMGQARAAGGLPPPSE